MLLSITGTGLKLSYFIGMQCIQLYDINKIVSGRYFPTFSDVILYKNMLEVCIQKIEDHMCLSNFQYNEITFTHCKNIQILYYKRTP